jgi:eukaryotic-like serine/threonine-protein kinase
VNESDIFNAALKLAAAERVQFLDLACKGNPDLRGRIEDLLQAHFDSGTFLREPNGQPANRQLSETMALNTAWEHPGTIIAGRYKLLEAIGEGGMGSVWLAEQSQPVKRKVALKVIKAGMDSKTVLARFEAERQALAVMDHPNIAKVLDGGLTEQGRPYFVMEYVKGIPINEYCDSRKLSVPERLQLFAQVCQAVQHAHQKGIIHRDLKPSNILVAPYDDKPIPKVIDFGLAKAIHQSLTENTLHTGHDMVLGTPLYMSPEQAQLNNIDIDTRSDVYSLGVLLYELLTGSTPLEKQRFKQAAWDEMRRMIREVDPPLPSQRLSSAETLPSVAAGRHSEPARLTRLVRGELDWIVMKALEKDRTRRYETANGFAADVLRYLAGEPVMAAPPSTVYRLQKFVRRNQGKVIAAGLVLAALLVGTAGTTWQWYRAEQSLTAEAAARQIAEENQRAAEVARAEAIRQQGRAEEQEAEAIKQAAAAREQEAEAKRQAEIAEAVAKFQTDMLAAVDPNQLPKDPVTKEPMKDAVTVVQALAAAVQVLDEGSLKDQPLVEANVRDTIGITFLSLARYADAKLNLQKSLEIRRVALPARHPDIASSMNNLAMLLLDQNQLDEAEPLFREALEIDREVFPPGHPQIATPLVNLAGLLLAQNKLNEAEPLFREALAIWRAAFPAGHPDIALGLNNLAMLLGDQNKLEEAALLFREALEIMRGSLPAGHPDIGGVLNNLAGLLQAQNKLGEAEPLYRESLEIYREIFPAGHPEIGKAINNLAGLLLAQNKLDEAEPLFREALAIWRTALPAGHPDIATALNNLGVLLRNQNKLDEAEAFFRESLDSHREVFPPGHLEIAKSLYNFARLLQDQNKLAEAEPLYREALAIWRAAFPAGHANIARCLSNLASLLEAQDSLAEAESLYREALEICRAALPSGHPEIAEVLNSLANLLKVKNQLDEAEPLYREALEIKRASLPAGHPEIASGLDNLAWLSWKLGRLDRSIPMFEESLTMFEIADGRSHPNTLMTVANLGKNYMDAGRFAEAIPLLEEAYRASATHISLRWVSTPLIDAYAKSGETAKAKDLIQVQMAVARQSLSAESPHLAAQLAHFGMTLLDLKSWDEAESLLREALTIRNKTEPEAWPTFYVQSMLGGALLGQKKFAEAEPLLLAGFEGLKKKEASIPPQGTARIPEALERLVQLYTDWHAAEPNEGYDAKAAEWQQKLDQHNAASAAEKPSSSSEK